MKVCCSFSVTFSAYLHCVTCSSAGVNDAAAGGVAGVNADVVVGVAGVNADAAVGVAGVNADAAVGVAGVNADAAAGVGVVVGAGNGINDANAAGVKADASITGGKAGALPPPVPSSHSILGRFRCIPDELCSECPYDCTICTICDLCKKCNTLGIEEQSQKFHFVAFVGSQSTFLLQSRTTMWLTQAKKKTWTAEPLQKSSSSSDRAQSSLCAKTPLTVLQPCLNC